MRRARRDHLRRDNGTRKTTAKQGAKRIPAHPKAALAGCFAKTSSAYHGTPAQPQFTQWEQPILGGVEFPERGARRSLAVRPTLGGVATNTSETD